MDNQSIDVFAGIAGLIFLLALIVFIGYLYWRIASKAGYPGAMGLLMFVPLANIIMIIIFAFSEWPIQREMKELRMGKGYAPDDYSR